MALDDLNLEFEDEEEVKRKKNDAMQVDVDLEFHSPVGSPSDKSRAQNVPGKVEPKVQAVPVKPSAPGPQARATTAPAQSNVKNINEARPQQLGAIKRPSAVGSTAQQSPAAPAQSVQQPRVSGSSALQTDEYASFESQELVETREQMKRVEFDAAVKVSVAEFKTEILSELNGDMKLLEHQINQLLVRINAKHPDMKNEVLMIKKLVTDFSAKKRK